jgi:hypothetical protein
VRARAVDRLRSGVICLRGVGSVMGVGEGFWRAIEEIYLRVEVTAMSFIYVLFLVMVVGGVAWSMSERRRRFERPHRSGYRELPDDSHKEEKERKKEKKKRKSGPRTLLNLQINDIVSHFDVDYLVRATALYEEEGEQWFEYMLEGGADGVVWLNALPNGDDVDAFFYRTVNDLNVGGKPGEVVEHRGVRYRLQRKGEARAERESATSGESEGVYKYYAYEGDGGELLSIEAKAGGVYEVSVGEPVMAYALQILPGDEITAQRERDL